MERTAFRARFQPLLEAFLRNAAARAMALAADDVLERMIRYVETLAASDGKRVRPFMAWLAYKGTAGNKDPGTSEEEAVLKMLVSLELFHMFALVHDDVMDRGVMRHGMPTMHRMAAELLQAEHRSGDTAHVGEAHAILLGDLLYEWSQDLFFGTPGVDAAARERAAPYFRTMIEEVIIGQMMDIDLTTRTNATDAFVQRKSDLKTASYTFVRPLQIGASLAGASSEMLAWCERFGLALGRAFQLQDDLLDLTAPTEGTGKTVFSDLQEGQHTMFTQFIVGEGTDEQKTALQLLMGTSLNESDRPRVTALFESSGAFAFGRAEIARLFTEAEYLLNEAAMNDASRLLFREFISGMRRRTA